MRDLSAAPEQGTVGGESARSAGVTAAAYKCFLRRRRRDRPALSSTAQQWITAFAVMAVWPSLVLVPMAMGIAAAYFWRSLSFSLGEYFLWWIVTSLISPFGAYFAFKEGAVCLLIGFPILFVCGL